MGKKCAKKRQAGPALCRAGRKFSAPPRLEIKHRQTRRTNCLGRMTGRVRLKPGRLVRAGQWGKVGGKSRVRGKHLHVAGSGQSSSEYDMQIVSELVRHHGPK